MMFKFGDIIENHWAADSNPLRRSIVIKDNGISGIKIKVIYKTKGCGAYESIETLEGNKEARTRIVKVGEIWGKAYKEVKQELLERSERKSE